MPWPGNELPVAELHRTVAFEGRSTRLNYGALFSCFTTAVSHNHKAQETYIREMERMISCQKLNQLRLDVKVQVSSNHESAEGKFAT